MRSFLLNSILSLIFVYTFREIYRQSFDGEDDHSRNRWIDSGKYQANEMTFREGATSRDQLRSQARRGDNSLVRFSAIRSLARSLARLQLFEMSPMAVTRSIFNRAEISAGETTGKEPEWKESGEGRERGRKRDVGKRGSERGEQTRSISSVTTWQFDVTRTTSVSF